MPREKVAVSSSSAHAHSLSSPGSPATLGRGLPRHVSTVAGLSSSGTILRIISCLSLFLFVWAGCDLNSGKSSSLEQLGSFTISNDEQNGSLVVDSPWLRLRFGYRPVATTNFNQSGGNLYEYYDKQYNTPNIVALWDDGTGGTHAFAFGAGGIGSTTLYAVDHLSNYNPNSSYNFSMGDNANGGVLRSGPTRALVSGDSLQIAFVFDVKPTPLTGTGLEWYQITKTWTISPAGRIKLRHDWRILRSGYFAEPASRHHINPLWTQISRYGHLWDEPPSEPPGSNSRQNPENQWWHWTPNPTVAPECGDVAGGPGSPNQDAVHSDFVRLHGGPEYDFWFWPDNEGRGFESLGLYEVGYSAFGQSFNASVFEICHADRRLEGDGTHSYSLAPMAWFGFASPPRDRFKFLSAETQWVDSYAMEVRPTGEEFPVPLLETLASASIAAIQHNSDP